MKTVSVIGFSGSGKTTLVEALIARLVARGSTVAAIKHTHHEIKPISRGDTLRFQRAGAREVILAGENEAVVWRGNEPAEAIKSETVEELVALVRADWLLIEGYKLRPPGIVVVVERAGLACLPQWPPNVVAVVSNRPEHGVLPTFRHAEVEELAAFLDRIAR